MSSGLSEQCTKVLPGIRWNTHLTSWCVDVPTSAGKRYISPPFQSCTSYSQKDYNCRNAAAGRNSCRTDSCCTWSFYSDGAEHTLQPTAKHWLPKPCPYFLSPFLISLRSMNAKGRFGTEDYFFFSFLQGVVCVCVCACPSLRGGREGASGRLEIHVDFAFSETSHMYGTQYT